MTNSHAVLSNEDPAEFDRLLNELRAVYLPLNTVADSIVGDIAAARWQILRFEGIVDSQWELSLSGEAHSTAHALIHRFNRQIDQLHIRIARLERRLKFIHNNFPQEAPLPVEDTTIDGQNYEESEKPILVKDACPETIAFFRRHYPKSPIVISPRDDVSKVSSCINPAEKPGPRTSSAIPILGPPIVGNPEMFFEN